MCFITRATQLQFCGGFFIICQQFKLSLCVYVCIYVLFAVLKWLMTSAGRTFTTPVQQQLQLLPLLFKVRTNTHTHTGSSTALLPTQSYLPIKLNFSLHLLKMVRCSLSFYLSPSLSVFSLPLQIAPVEIDESYDEMKQDARTCLSLMSQGLLYPEHIPLVLAALEEVICTHKSRNTRKSTHSQLPHLPAVNVPSLISQGIVLD